MIPPKAALTFAVIWDPEDDLVAFSGAHLLDSAVDDDSKLLDSPSEAYDSHSQILTIGPATIPCGQSTALHSENTATLAFFRENHEFLFSTRTPPAELTRPCRTQRSSTLEGADVYLRGSMLSKAYAHHRYYSCLENLDADFQFDPRTSFAKVWLRELEGDSDSIDDEGFFEMRIQSSSSFRTMDDGHSADDRSVCLISARYCLLTSP